MGYRHCRFYGFVLTGLKGKLALLFWESVPGNVQYIMWERNGICQIDKDMVNEWK